MNEIHAFYNKLCKIPVTADGRESIQWEYFTKHLDNFTLYKYISFTNDTSLNDVKLETLKHGHLWFAAHHTLCDNDPSEFEIYANIVEVHRKTKLSYPNIFELLGIFKELNDVCCFSDRLHEYMWQNYANNHSGICCVFSIVDVKQLFPVIYCNKKDSDFTRTFIQSIKNNFKDCESLRRLVLISPVLKDKQKYGEEHEIRLLNGDIFDKNDTILAGRIGSGKKAALGYQGTTYSYTKCGLELKKIIIGKNTPMEIQNRIKELPFVVANE